MNRYANAGPTPERRTWDSAGRVTPEAIAYARRERRAAAEACPHWDYEGNGDTGHWCCRALDRAEREVERLTANQAGNPPATETGD